MTMKMLMEAQHTEKHSFLLREHKKTRFFIDNEFFKWGYAAKYRKLSLIDVYCILAKHANHKSQMCFPSYETIMKESGIKNKNSLAKALQKLEELNIVRVLHSTGKHSNKYLLQDVSVWVRENGITDNTVQRYQKYHGVDSF